MRIRDCRSKHSRLVPSNLKARKNGTNIAKQKRHRSKLVNVGEETDKWNRLKDATGAENDSVFAKLLIDYYLERHTSQAVTQMSIPTTPGMKLPSYFSTPQTNNPATVTEIPDLSSVTSGSETEARVARHKLLKRKKTDVEAGLSKVRKSELVDIEMSSTDLEDFYDPNYDPDDSTFQPHDWINISIVQSDVEAHEEQGVEDDVFDIGGEEEQEERRNIPPDPGVPKLKEVEEEHVIEEKYIISRGRLEALLDMFPQTKCTRCGKTVTKKIKKIGCTVECNWLCEDGHSSYRWSSSAMMPNGIFLTNFQAMSSVLLSGNNFTKISPFTQFLGLAFPSRSTSNRIQTKCVVPVVDAYWRNIQQSALEEHRAMNVIVSGDGRMDSPGHTAKYCTYTVMNQEDKAILALEIVDKRETALKSVLMEAKGFKQAMISIKDAGVELKEVVTDAHPQISKIMNKWTYL